METQNSSFGRRTLCKFAGVIPFTILTLCDWPHDFWNTGLLVPTNVCSMVIIPAKQWDVDKPCGGAWWEKGMRIRVHFCGCSMGSKSIELVVNSATLRSWTQTSISKLKQTLKQMMTESSNCLIPLQIVCLRPSVNPIQMMLSVSKRHAPVTHVFDIKGIRFASLMWCFDQGYVHNIPSTCFQ